MWSIRPRRVSRCSVGRFGLTFGGGNRPTGEIPYVEDHRRTSLRHHPGRQDESVTNPDTSVTEFTWRSVCVISTPFPRHMRFHEGVQLPGHIEGLIILRRQLISPARSSVQTLSSIAQLSTANRHASRSVKRAPSPRRAVSLVDVSRSRNKTSNALRVRVSLGSRVACFAAKHASA